MLKLIFVLSRESRPRSVSSVDQNMMLMILRWEIWFVSKSPAYSISSKSAELSRIADST